jgi:hypothetical protein
VNEKYSSQSEDINSHEPEGELTAPQLEVNEHGQFFESIKNVDTVNQVEAELLEMPSTVIREIEMGGNPEIAKVLLSGALVLGLLTAPETGFAGQEHISIPAEHVAQFENQTGIKLKELSEKYGLQIDHSIVTPGAKTWVIHVGQMHDQLESEAPPSERVIKSQQKVYGALEEIKMKGVDTIFDEGHTENTKDVRTAIQQACESARSGTSVNNEEIYGVNDFFNTTVRSFITAPEAEKGGTRRSELIQKIGAATILGCEGKLKVLPAEDYETNQAITSLDVIGDKEEVMAPYRSALVDAIKIGYIQTGLLNFGDRSAINAYGEAVTKFLHYDFDASQFDFDPMSTLLSKLKDKEVRGVFEEFNEKFEKTKNKRLKFDRESVALKNIGEYVVTHPDTKVVPLVYGSIHNFVSSLPAYNTSHPVKFNYIRMNTVDLKGGWHALMGEQ